MDDRASLIERAAALIQSGDAPPASPTSAADPLLVPERRTPPAALPLARQCNLDRASLMKGGIVMPGMMNSRLAEEFRIIKRNIIGAWQPSGAEVGRRRAARTLMITSARPKEGKTFNTINLALAFSSEPGLTVILIDGDTLRPGIAKVVGMSNKPGLSELLSGGCTLADALVQSDTPNLILLPAGESDHHTPELLAGRAMADVLEEITSRYPDSVVVMDTSPTLASSGPTSLAPYVDQIVFVVEAGHTQQQEIESSIRLLNGCQNISFILNKSIAITSEHFGSYAYYYRSEDNN